jgi:hypothetical protein
MENTINVMTDDLATIAIQIKIAKGEELTQREQEYIACNAPALLGKKVIIDGWDATIIDTNITADGTAYVAVIVKAAQALYLENQWLNLKTLTVA